MLAFDPVETYYNGIEPIILLLLSTVRFTPSEIQRLNGRCIFLCKKVLALCDNIVYNR